MLDMTNGEKRTVWSTLKSFVVNYFHLISLILVFVLAAFISLITDQKLSWDLIWKVLAVLSIGGLISLGFLYVIGAHLFKFQISELKNLFAQITAKETKDTLSKLIEYMEFHRRIGQTYPLPKNRLTSRSEYAQFIKEKNLWPKSMWIRGVTLEVGGTDEASEIHYKFIKDCLDHNVEIRYLCKGDEDDIAEKARNLAQKLLKDGITKKSLCVRLIPTDEKAALGVYTLYNGKEIYDNRFLHEHYIPAPDLPQEPAYIRLRGECNEYVINFRTTFEKAGRNEKICGKGENPNLRLACDEKCTL